MSNMRLRALSGRINSVYGCNTKSSFFDSDPVDHSVSLHAVTKKANELMAHSCNHLYGLLTTGLRFITVVGPWGRPNMEPWLFANALLEGSTIDVYNHGEIQRDFAYIDDVAEGTVRVFDRIAQAASEFSKEHPTPGESYGPHKIYNICCHQSVKLIALIQTREPALGGKANMRLLPMQEGDVIFMNAEMEKLLHDTAYAVGIELNIGLPNWVNWFRSFQCKR